jgi:hypothetical protein
MVSDSDHLVKAGAVAAYDENRLGRLVIYVATEHDPARGGATESLATDTRH